MTPQKRPTSIIILVTVGFFILTGVGGFFVGKKWSKPPAAVIDYHKIDSLTQVNLTLQDSLNSVNEKVRDVYKDVIKYRTKYDTIRLSNNAEDIVHDLHFIVNEPIPGEIK